MSVLLPTPLDWWQLPGMLRKILRPCTGTRGKEGCGRFSMFTMSEMDGICVLHALWGHLGT